MSSSWREPKLRDDVGLSDVDGTTYASSQTSGRRVALEAPLDVVARCLDGVRGPAELLAEAEIRGYRLSVVGLFSALEKLKQHQLLDPRAPLVFLGQVAPADPAEDDAATIVYGVAEETGVGGFLAGRVQQDTMRVPTLGQLVHNSGPVATLAARQTDDDAEEQTVVDPHLADEIMQSAREQQVEIVNPDLDRYPRSQRMEVPGRYLPVVAKAPPQWEADKQRLFNSALVMYKQGLAVEATRYLKALIELDPSNQEALHMLEIIAMEAKRRSVTSLESMQRELVHELDAQDAQDAAGAAMVPRAAADGDEDEDDEEDDEEDGWQDAASTPGARLRRWAIRLGVLGVAVAALAVIPWPLTAKGDCVLVPSERRLVRATIDGLIERVAVREGQHVPKGLEAVVLDTSAIDRSLETVKAQIAQVDAELRILERGATPEDRRRAKEAVRGRAVAVQLKRSECARLKRLVKQGVMPPDRWRACNAAQQQLSAALAEEKARAAVTERPPSAAELARVQAKRDALVAQRRHLDHQRAAARIQSPIAGTVVTPNVSEKVGMRVSRGDTVFEVVNDGVMVIEIKVPEEDIDLLDGTGLPVALKVPSIPARTFHGKVTSITAKVHTDKATGLRYVLVRSSIANPKRVLRPDMAGVAEVRRGKRSLLYHAGRRLIRFVRLRFLI